MDIGGAASTLLSLANDVQGRQLPEGERKNDKQHDGSFIGHRVLSFFILRKIFDDHERA